ncbi:hypothetical protein B0H10DRAFT_1955663 [Mycena sp. CBHHK59/15]|nr:hypothetical protein B0H10DRAFT_1955663 [Mycena sp. CBHHK59/15]
MCINRVPTALLALTPLSPYLSATMSSYEEDFVIGTSQRLRGKPAGDHLGLLPGELLHGTGKQANAHASTTVGATSDFSDLIQPGRVNLRGLVNSTPSLAVHGTHAPITSYPRNRSYPRNVPLPTPHLVHARKTMQAWPQTLAGIKWQKISDEVESVHNEIHALKAVAAWLCCRHRKLHQQLVTMDDEEKENTGLGN